MSARVLGARVAILVGLAASFVAGGTRPAAAALSNVERTTVRAYLDALSHERYDAAFALLAPDERRYFASARNYASGYIADDVALVSYRIVGSERSSSGTVAVVSERVSFRDHRFESKASVVATVPLAIVRTSGGAAIRDPGHPWRADAPQNVVADVGNVRATVRKISFFTGRVEWVVNFQNRGPVSVTILPFGRTILRDASGAVYRPIASRAAGLMDPGLYAGVRLPARGEYTGFLTFATPSRLEPASLRLTVAPALADGGDAPFELNFTPYVPPRA